MGCDIVFKINGNLRGGLSEEGQLSNQIIIKDSSLLSDAGLQGMNEYLKSIKEVSLPNIVSELLKSDNVEIKTQLVSIVKNLQDTSSRSVSAADIKQKGIIGNYKYHTLKYKLLFFAFCYLGNDWIRKSIRQKIIQVFFIRCRRTLCI